MCFFTINYGCKLNTKVKNTLLAPYNTNNNIVYGIGMSYILCIMYVLGTLWRHFTFI